MKKIIAIISMVFIIFTNNMAFAARQYIIPDSYTRHLSQEELLEWDYESIGFIFNEIFARHGYNFIEGQVYDRYFRTRPWYTPNQNPNNTVACYPQLNSIEWDNEKLCKNLREYMRSINWQNHGAKNFRDYVEWGFDVLDGFIYTEFSKNQKLKIYSCPSENSYRGANGKAVVSTNGAIYVAGMENGWCLCMYETNNGAVRVGYFNSTQTKDHLNTTNLNFSYRKICIENDSYITDDPATYQSNIMRINKGQQVVYLDTYMNRRSWAYVETAMPSGEKIRGFIPFEDINITNESDVNG